MVLQHGITGITGIIWFCDGSPKFMIAWQGSIWDNREVRAGRPVVIAALPSRAGGELGR